ncbi:DUF3578 domain-containing protein [Streptomyces sp. 43Y-GA-1]|uniref:MrcB family domain-containing protein n=1 Tax=Streptomyces sp. 43Y-GA-1 TaxID=2939435 RepID=UPI0020BEAD63|nr:DUF3578 domain-containing protein [Streptomyces sp. 43Y-GA-1]MCL6293300.1 DUF3578 domain-containing protein [Streptomyces sp. 43Y-GA-1]
MDSLLREVLDLQQSWTAKKNPEMDERGFLITSQLPAELRKSLPLLASVLGVAEAEVGVEGSNGAGFNAKIPWVRVYEPRRSPGATIGWYLVYLFSTTGDRVYLSLIQGTTVWTGGMFAPRKPAELQSRVDWARPLLSSSVTSRTDLVTSLTLQGNQARLSSSYEAGNVVAIEYQREKIPESSKLLDDLLFMTGLLRDVYRAEDTASYVPGDPVPEVVEAQEAAARTAGRRKRTAPGQGFRLSADERRAVELHAVQMATAHFVKQGWSVKDVGAKESYDLLLSRGDERLHVEVKGTTSAGGQVILTRAEVERQRELAPDNALVVVHSIILDRSAPTSIAGGGILECLTPWTIADEDLTVVSFVYRTGL